MRGLLSLGWTGRTLKPSGSERSWFVMRKLSKFSGKSPEYILGRFLVVRSLFSYVKRFEQKLSVRAPEFHISEKYGSNRSRLMPALSPLLDNALGPAIHVDRLRRTAVSEDIRLTPDACRVLLAVGRSSPLEGGDITGITYANLVRSPEIRSKKAILSVADVSSVDAVRSIAADPRLIEVATLYLRYVPERVSAWLFWSIRNEMTLEEREAHHQTVRFHYDVHGLNFLYVNFYLTPTDEMSGAHVLIEGSHRKKRLWHLLGTARLDDGAALGNYGKKSLRTISGPAGSGFFEDASCYHKALVPIQRDRLMLQFRYL